MRIGYNLVGVIEFDPQPPPGSLPTRLASPFAPGVPHPLAQRAAVALQAELARGDWPELAQPGGGKMFGVLVVAGPEGRVGALRGFSGMLGGRWEVAGFAPPLFDASAIAGFWPAGLAELAALEREHRVTSAQAAAGEATLARAVADHRAEREALRAQHRERRAARHQARHQARPHTPSPDQALALDQQSRADTAERRQLDARHRAAELALTTAHEPLAAAARTLADRRAARSKRLLAQLHAAYAIRNARAESCSLPSLFAPRLPPAGAGDCAGPKLLADAYRRGLRPLALAEFFWGSPSLTQARRSGEYYPACRGKCGPILPFMLEGLAVEAAPAWGADASAIPDPTRVFEDDWLLVVDKPCGLLSVPGRHERLRDSVQVRLAASLGSAATFMVHRLDLDTSGLLLIAKDRETHAALQKQFALRTITKRYLAWLEGSPQRDEGEIALALRVDHDDRPRQIHDPVHGKSARTLWRVLERRGDRTLVALTPETGRTHQLRVHAAHPLGIGAPIVGDRLYGRPDTRLLLHAETLAFDHPRTGVRIELRSPAPFDAG